MERRTLTGGITISPIALGCLPFAGTPGFQLNEEDSTACIAASLDCGINFFDTAFAYGANGESELLLGRGLRERRNEAVVATKVGIAIDERGSQVRDGSPNNLQRQCEESLKRLGLESVDILYLHAPDPNVPIRESAGMMHELLRSGKTRMVGLSNASLQEIQSFATECPLTIYQGAYNMLQRGLEREIISWCKENDVAIAAYWVLMRGLLTGTLVRDHLFDPLDKRGRWQLCQGKEWERLQNLLDALRALAQESDKTVAQIVARWTIERDGIDVALCGATRSSQVCENAGAMNWNLNESQKRSISLALETYAMTN